MQVYIKSIEQIAEDRFLARISLDDRVVLAQITESRDNRLPGFNFDHRFFDALFAFNGLGARFNRDYWRFRQEQHDPFPWDYGIHEQEILDRAMNVTHTKLESLRCTDE